MDKCLNTGWMNKVSESNVMEGAKEEIKLMWERNVNKISVHPEKINVGKSPVIFMIWALVNIVCEYSTVYHLQH